MMSGQNNKSNIKMKIPNIDEADCSIHQAKQYERQRQFDLMQHLKGQEERNVTPGGDDDRVLDQEGPTTRNTNPKTPHSRPNQPNVITDIVLDIKDIFNKRHVKPIKGGNRIDINQLKRSYIKIFEEWWEQDKSQVKSALGQGQSLHNSIKQAREKGYFTVSFNGFKLNINPDSSKIATTDLTKSRFYALLHLFIQEKFDAEMNCDEQETFLTSPLICKICMDPDNPLYSYRFLLGSGYQYLRPVFGNANDHEATLLYLTGAFVLDYLSAQSARSSRYKKVKTVKTFVDYVKTDFARQGEVLLASARNMGDPSLHCLQKASSVVVIINHARRIKFDMTRSGAACKVYAGWKAALKHLTK